MELCANVAVKFFLPHGMLYFSFSNITAVLTLLLLLLLLCKPHREYITQIMVQMSSIITEW